MSLKLWYIQIAQRNAKRLGDQASSETCGGRASWHASISPSLFAQDRLDIHQKLAPDIVFDYDLNHFTILNQELHMLRQLACSENCVEAKAS
jgi:hypothetical protein